MGAIDLSRFIWPDADQGRQPQHVAPVDEASQLSAALVYAGNGPGRLGFFDAVGNTALTLSGVSRGSRSCGTSLIFGGSATAQTSSGFGGDLTNGLTVVAVFTPDVSGSKRTIIGIQGSTGIALFADSSDGIGLDVTGNYNVFTAGSLGITAGTKHVIAISYTRSVGYAIALDGKIIASGVDSGGAGPVSAFRIGCRPGDASEAFNGGISSYLAFSSPKSNSQLVDLTRNPWQLFKSPLAIFMSQSAGGSSAIAAAGGDTASGSANLSAQVALAAVGVSTASGSAGATVSVPLSAAGLDVSSGTANAVATITISAAGLAQAAGQAGLSAAVLIAAAGAAQAAGNGTLAARLNALASGGDQAGGTANLSGGAAGALSAAGGDVASGSAVLAVSIQLAAIGGDVAGGSANLTGGAPGALAASGGDVAGGSATVSAGVKISATGGDVASGSANLSGGAPGALAASGGDVAGGSATWSSLVTVTAAGFVQAMGAGALVVQVPISATGHDYAGGSANAALAGLVRNFRLIAAPAKRLTNAGIGANRLTTLYHEVSHG